MDARPRHPAARSPDGGLCPIGQPVDSRTEGSIVPNSRNSAVPSFDQRLSMKSLIVSLLLTLLCGSSSRSSAAEYEVVIYGGTSAGVISAVQAKKMSKSVIIVCPEKHLGGLSSGGLGFTDTGNKAVIGGLSREFYHRVWKYYDQPSAWTWQKK